MKERLDILLVKRGLVDSRQKAQSLIMAGEVVVDNQRVDKAGARFLIDCDLRIKAQVPYVSRGGLKLESVYESLCFEVKNFSFMDVGSSTGGFTDFLLKRGARRVFCVDVGTNQLHNKLRQDERVVSREQTHILNLKIEDLPFPIESIVMDVSFISVTRLFDHLSTLGEQGHRLICLIKPQFEVGKNQVGSKGVVKDFDLTLNSLRVALNSLREAGYNLKKLDYCRIPGPNGNVEYFALAVHEIGSDKLCDEEMIRTVVQQRFSDSSLPFSKLTK